jgi:hypothetical protein
LSKPITLESSVLDEFEELLAEEEILYTTEKYEESRDFMLKKIEEEIHFKLYGRHEAYRVAVEHDQLVEKAKNLLSQAESFEELYHLVNQL